MENQITYRWGDPYKNTIKRFDEDGTVWTIPLDSGNIDYQAYLAWVEEGNEPGVYLISTPADGIEDLGTAKTASCDRTRQTAHSLLLPTDWVTARKIDTGEDAPADIEAFRSAVRSAAAEKIEAIGKQSSLESLMSYLRSDAFVKWPEM